MTTLQVMMGPSWPLLLIVGICLMTSSLVIRSTRMLISVFRTHIVDRPRARNFRGCVTKNLETMRRDRASRDTSPICEGRADVLQYFLPP